MKGQKKGNLKKIMLLSVLLLLTLISFLLIFLTRGLDGAVIFMRIICFLCLLVISIYVYKSLIVDIHMQQFNEILSTVQLSKEYNSVEEMQEAYQAQRNMAVFQDSNITITKDFLYLKGINPPLFLLDGILLTQSYWENKNGVMTAVNLDVLYYDGNVYTLKFANTKRKLNDQLVDRVDEAVSMLSEKCCNYGKNPILFKVMSIKMKGKR